MSRLLADLAYKAGAIAMAILGGAVFLAGAIVGASMVGRLGGAGWLIYGVLLGSFALVFGPVVASAVKMFQRGSRRHRAATERRIEEQQTKFHLKDGCRGL
jgi:uncharacterized membrane protein